MHLGRRTGECKREIRVVAPSLSIITVLDWFGLVTMEEGQDDLNWPLEPAGTLTIVSADGRCWSSSFHSSQSFALCRLVASYLCLVVTAGSRLMTGTQASREGNPRSGGNVAQMIINC